ncbi:MAG: hypothetical protein HY674_09525, partial [Chloroflexi bacterium]|nr:hypothetical protein [Chloroflexota bacterium]
PVDPENTNEEDISRLFVQEGAGPVSYTESRRFVATGLFRDVLFSKAGLVHFQLPPDFLVVRGQMEEVQIRFPGIPILYTDGQAKGEYHGFVPIEPGQIFVWDFSSVPLDANRAAEITFVVRAVVDGQALDAVGKFNYKSLTTAMAPNCGTMCQDSFYPTFRPNWWPLADWVNRPTNPSDFFGGAKPAWWMPSIPWPTPLSFYFTGFPSPFLQIFGIHSYICDPQVWGPLYDSGTGAVGQGTQGGNNWAGGFNLRLFPATHRLGDPLSCQAENLIIVVDGIDILNNRTAADIWNDMGPGLQKVLDKGYDVLVLDYVNGRDYIQRNGYALQYVLENVVPTYFKAEYRHHRVAIVAASMGTQVARYALCKTEEIGKDHHTGLAIYLDGPFLGANIPWSLQGFVSFFAAVNQDPGAAALLAGLQSPAAQQLLRGSLSYGPSQKYSQYYNEANALLDGHGLPKRLRNVAVSSGSGLGFTGVGSQVGSTSWNLSFAKVATGKQKIPGSKKKWHELKLDAKAEGSSSPTFHAMARGGIFGVTLKKYEWVWHILQGARPVDLSPGGFRDGGASAVQTYNAAAPSGMNTMTSEALNHDFIPLFSSLYVRAAETPGSETYQAKKTYGSLALGSSISFTYTGSRTKADFWYGPEQASLAIDPATKLLSPFDAIWYHHKNAEHVLNPSAGYEAFMLNELDQFNSHERFGSDSLLDTLPKRHSHEVILLGDLEGGAEDELLTINTFQGTAMIQRLVQFAPPLGGLDWEKLWESSLGWIGGWAINKGDKFLLLRRTNAKALLLSFSVANPAWAMVQAFRFDPAQNGYVWEVLWDNQGNGLIGPCRVRPTNLYATGRAMDFPTDQLLVAYPYVANDIRERISPGTSGLSEACLLSFLPSAGGGYVWAQIWDNSTQLHKIGETPIRFGDHLEFGKIDPSNPFDNLLSINLLRGVFGGPAVAQKFDVTPPTWSETWTDLGAGIIGSWHLGNPRDSFHFGDLDGSGSDEFIAFNDSWFHVHRYQNGTWTLSDSASPPTSVVGIHPLQAGDRFVFGNVDSSDGPSEEVLMLNPETQGQAVIERWTPTTSPSWTPIWQGTGGYLGHWQLYL